MFSIHSLNGNFLQDAICLYIDFNLNCIQPGLDKLYIHKQVVPCEDHKCLSIISAGRELCSVGLQHSQTQLEDDFDSMEEEAVDHADSTWERQDAEEEGEEPR